ncbi:6-bladed beta-propeller [Parabacteroides sp. AM08-6]|uniref:6-bladed beta-propeller n=1 Tax=Parabacteroides sp. AM08-6 TaxID=2292053 RepID=UPI000F00AEDA|nr:6-bladed beta-propeller [Parabacteroides sp. AM08-6]RHJ85462.1 6-bladed beta-propeller [Parabacteroides sp. AM08-6]
MKKKFFILCIYLMNIGLLESQNNSSSQYIIDIDNATNLGRIPISHFFKSLKIIPLETTEDCLIGRIDEMQTCGDRLFICDNNIANAIFVYNREGKFLKKIANRGGGPEEYNQIESFCIDSLNNSILLLDNSKHKIIEYNFITGEYIQSISLKGDITPCHIFKINNTLYGDLYYYNTNIPANNCYLLQKIDLKTGNIIEKYFPVYQYNRGWTNRNFIESYAFYPIYSNHCLFVQSFMDTVMLINPEGVSPYFTIKSKNFVTNNIINNFIESKSPQENIPFYMLENKSIYKISEIIESKSQIWFSYMQGFGLTKAYYNALENKTYTYTQFNDLLLDKDRGITYIQPNYLIAEKEGFFYQVTSDNIPVIKHFAQQGFLNPKIGNIEYLKNIDDEDSNPILFYYEFK